MADQADSRDEPSRWMVAGPRWPAWVSKSFLLACSVAFLLVVGVAVLGRLTWAAMGGAGAAAYAVYLQDREYWTLNSTDRVQVWRASRTGRPSGSARLDAIALDRLRKAERTARSDLIVVRVMLAVSVALPIVAAIRVSPWWLLALFPTVIWIQALAFRSKTDRGERLLALESALAPPAEH